MAEEERSMKGGVVPPAGLGIRVRTFCTVAHALMRATSAIVPTLGVRAQGRVETSLDMARRVRAPRFLLLSYSCPYP